MNGKIILILPLAIAYKLIQMSVHTEMLQKRTSLDIISSTRYVPKTSFKSILQLGKKDFASSVLK